MYNSNKFYINVIDLTLLRTSSSPLKKYITLSDKFFFP